MHKTDPSARVTGLCKLLARSFYPEYRFSKRMLSGDAVAHGGRTLGSKVDRQLFAHIEHRDKLRSGAKKRCALDPYASRIRDFLLQDYDLRAAQVGVGALLTGNHWLFTAVDLVCNVRGKKDEVVLVEVKCKQSSYYEQSTGQLRTPYAQQKNHQRNQDQLQLGLTKWLYEQTFPGHRVAGALVVRAHEGGIHHYPLEDWVLKQRGAAISGIIGQLYSGRPATIRRPRTSKKNQSKSQSKKASHKSNNRSKKTSKKRSKKAPSKRPTKRPRPLA